MTDDALIDYIAQHHESGGSFCAWNPDDRGAGISFGLIQFNQKRGGLLDLFRRCADKNIDEFKKVMHPYGLQFLGESFVRTAELNRPEYKSRIIELGKIPIFQDAQRELAKELYLFKAKKICEKFYLGSERAIAMAADLAIQYGPGGLESRLLRSVCVLAGTPGERPGDSKQFAKMWHEALLQTLAGLADVHDYDKSRRRQMLNEPRFSDEIPEIFVDALDKIRG